MVSIDRLLQGSIDMHVHHGPDDLVERRMDAWETALHAQSLGMGGVVLKSHSFPTGLVAGVIQPRVRDVAIIGSLCLELETGGINPFAVEASAKVGAQVLWFPTFSAANSRAAVARRLKLPLRGEGISILDPQGKLVPQVTQVLEVVKEYGMVLCSGHLSPAETFALIEEACRVGVTRMVITHPLAKEASALTPSIEEQQQLAQRGAFIEHCFLTLMPTGGKMDPAQMVAAMRAVGAERCIMTTDFGQAPNPPFGEGIRLFIATLLKHGMTEEEVEVMVKANPAKLLRLS